MNAREAAEKAAETIEKIENPIARADAWVKLTDAITRVDELEAAGGVARP